MDHFCSKNKFCQLQLKRNIQRIYLTLISTICVKIRRIPYIFETLSHFSRHNSSVFFGSNITYFLQMQSIKVEIFRLASASIKIHQICQVIFEAKNQFFVNVWVTLQCTFLAETLYAVEKSSTSMCKFSELILLALKITKWFMSFLERRVSFSSNITLHNSSVLCHFSSHMSAFLQILHHPSVS